MGKNAMTTAFLKECMADSLLKLMEEKAFSKITIKEITAGANVNRSTWFRHFSAKNEALTFKLVQLWYRRADERQLREKCKFSKDNAEQFFLFNYDNRELLRKIYRSGLQTAVYDAFYKVMVVEQGEDVYERYQGGFYSYGLFGLLDEWIKRDFCETPEEITEIFSKMIG